MEKRPKQTKIAKQENWCLHYLQLAVTWKTDYVQRCICRLHAQRFFNTEQLRSASLNVVVVSSDIIVLIWDHAGSICILNRWYVLPTSHDVIWGSYNVMILEQSPSWSAIWDILTHFSKVVLKCWKMLNLFKYINLTSTKLNTEEFKIWKKTCLQIRVNIINCFTCW